MFTIATAIGLTDLQMHLHILFAFLP